MVVESNCFRKELLVLKLVGLSLMGNESFLYKVYSYTAIASINFFYPTWQFLNSFKYEFDVVVHILIYDIALLGSFVKTLVVFIRRKKIKQVIDKLENAMSAIRVAPKSSSEIAMVNTCNFVTSAQLYMYWITALGCIVVTAVIYFLKYLRNDDPNYWELPFGEMDLLNTTYSGNYKLMLLYQVSNVGFLACHFLTIDLITANVLCHLSYHFKILQERVSQLVHRARQEKLKKERDITDIIPINGENINYERDWIYLKNHLKEIINYHLLIIEIANEMEEVFNKLILLIILDTLILLCFLIYYISSIEINYPLLLPYFCEFSVTCLQIFMVCFWGEQISEESQKVAVAVTEMDFIGCDLKFQKALTMIMLRSQRPITLTAGKFATVGLTTFGWIVRSSYSAFIMLKNVNESK